MKQEIGQRILIVGDSNAGKSTLAAHLGRVLNVEFVDLDALYWLPKWQARDGDSFVSLLSETLKADRSWVAAGNYANYEVHWLRAETIIWLDYPLRITLPRIMQRSWRRWRRRELLWGTNYERMIDQFMLWDQQRSLVAYAVRNHRRKRVKFAGLMRDPRFAHVTFKRFGRPHETEAWLKSLGLSLEVGSRDRVNA